MESEKEYQGGHYYFDVVPQGDNFVVKYFVVDNNNLTESDKKLQKITFPIEKWNEVKKFITETIKAKKPKSAKEVGHILKKIKHKKGEIEELVDFDGTMKSSKLPIINKLLAPKKTTDQTVVATRQTNTPILRGYRVFYGESEIKESDMSGAFGYEETKDMDGKETYEFLIKKMGMEPDEAKSRTKELGKDPSGKQKKKADPSIKKQKGFIDRLNLYEYQRAEMMKMVEDIVLNKKKKDSDISEKDKKISKILLKNLKSLKKMADKEGLSTSQLIKLLKNEQ